MSQQHFMSYKMATPICRRSLTLIFIRSEFRDFKLSFSIFAGFYFVCIDLSLPVL